MIRSNRKNLDEVCLDCMENFVKLVNCEECAIEQLKSILENLEREEL